LGDAVDQGAADAVELGRGKTEHGDLSPTLESRWKVRVVDRGKAAAGFGECGVDELLDDVLLGVEGGGGRRYRLPGRRWGRRGLGGWGGCRQGLGVRPTVL
jgi:hypothetical protein